MRDLGIFIAGFFLFWTIAVLLVWKLALLPEAARPWFRNAA